MSSDAGNLRAMYADGYANSHLQDLISGLCSEGGGGRVEGYFNEAAPSPSGPLNPGGCQRQKAP